MSMLLQSSLSIFETHGQRMWYYAGVRYVDCGVDEDGNGGVLVCWRLSKREREMRNEDEEWRRWRGYRGSGGLVF